MNDLVKLLRQLGAWVEHAQTEPRPHDAISIDDVDWLDLYNSADAIEELVAVLDIVVNSDMAMREEDEGRISDTLGLVRTALAYYKEQPNDQD